MKAAVMEAYQRPLVLQEVPDPQPAQHGVVLKVEATGICRSDWHAWTGDFTWVKTPRILGHEFCGVVEEVGPDVKRFGRGDRVIVPFSLGDGTCPMCRMGHANICDNRVVPGLHYDGGFAQYTAIPHADQNLVTLPEGVSFRDAAALGCRFMTSFHGVVDQAQVRPGEWVVVFGCGGIGLSAVNIASAIGANVIAVDINNAQLELARSMGAVFTVNSREADAVEAVKTLTGGGAHVSVDGLGITATCQGAIHSLRKRGRHLQIGMTTKAENGYIPLPVDLIVRNELQVVGSLGMQPERYAAMLPLIEQGRLVPGKLVTGEVHLSDAGRILEEMTGFGGVGVKVITRWD